MNYYNEIDPKAAAWLRELINRDLIAPGVVDERSIEDVVPSDLKGFTQCHFFAGIGGWSYALRLAGWPDDKPVWTGSCPCQPFSTAGKGAGFNDERHLWPAWFHLIKQCKPKQIFGEQSASKDALEWLDLVSGDLEGEGYTVGAIDICSAGFTDADIRQRLYWMGDSEGQRCRETRLLGSRPPQRLADASAVSRMEHAKLSAKERQQQHGWKVVSEQETERLGLPGSLGWVDRPVEWVSCADGFHRPVERGTFPLDYGIPANVVRLRGYGNAINPYAAKTFIEATQEALMDLADSQITEAA